MGSLPAEFAQKIDLETDPPRVSEEHVSILNVACLPLIVCLFLGSGITTSAQTLSPTIQMIDPYRGRPLALNQARYRVRAGDRTRIDAPTETLEFMRAAKTSTVTIDGSQTGGFAVGPNEGAGEILLAASLTMKAGEYAVTLSAVDKSGVERTAAAVVIVDALPVVPSGGSTPPVVLLNGWQFSVFPPSTCPIYAAGSAETFGSLATQLVSPVVYFFDNCVEQSVNGSTIEELGVTLGQFLNKIQYAGGTLVPQVDLVTHSMGGLIVRSYLAGLQPNDALSPSLNPGVRKFIEIATPNFGSFLAANYSGVIANGTQAAEMIPGSPFLWSLGTWNERGDDLRGVDALAIVGNAGYWKSSILASPQFLNASDGVVSLTSASLNFARGPSRTRILPYCHVDSTSAAGQFINCTGRGIANVNPDEAPETGQIVRSFLADTPAWQSIGLSNQTQYGGGYFALENAAGTQYTTFESVSFGSQLFFESGVTSTVFYSEFASGTETFQATSTANQTTNCGPFPVVGGYFSIFRCKFSPAISSVGPLLPNVPGWVVKSGGNITISGVGFGTRCSACQIEAYPGPVALQVSSWSDSAISALLPSTFSGIAEVVVQTTSGSDSITFMASPPALQSIAVTPANPSIMLAQTEQFVATGTYTDNSTQNLTRQVIWASASASTATISGAGLATGTGAGTSTISATFGAVSGSTLLTVTATGQCDVNLDGVTNVGDVQLEINEAFGVAQSIHDLNRDGVANLVDVQIVVNAAIGLGCAAT